MFSLPFEFGCSLWHLWPIEFDRNDSRPVSDLGLKKPTTSTSCFLEYLLWENLANMCVVWLPSDRQCQEVPASLWRARCPTSLHVSAVLAWAPHMWVKKPNEVSRPVKSLCYKYCFCERSCTYFCVNVSFHFSVIMSKNVIAASYSKCNFSFIGTARLFSRVTVILFLCILTMHRMLSHVRFFATTWTIACQAPLSIEFSRQKYWSE